MRSTISGGVSSYGAPVAGLGGPAGWLGEEDRRDSIFEKGCHAAGRIALAWLIPHSKG